MSFFEQIQANYILAGDVIPLSKHPDYKYKSEEFKKSDEEIVLKLQKMLHKEHLSGCHDDASCAINFAAENDLWYWAIELFKSSGAASSKFKTLYNQLSPEFKKEAEAERKVMASKPHKTCKHCHSVNWGKDSDKCGQCLNPISASEGTAMSYYNRILAASKVSTSYSELIVAAEAPFKGLPLANLASKYEAIAVKLDRHGKDFSKKEIEDMKKELLSLGFKKPEIAEMDDEDVIGTWQAETGYVEPDE